MSTQKATGFHGHRNKKKTTGEKSLRAALVLCLMAMGILAFSGCSAGPDYARPSVTVPSRYKETAGWKIARPAETAMRGQWWRLYHDPLLDSLEAGVNISSQTIIQAEARHRQALALVREARAGYFPVVTAGASYTRERSASGFVQSAAVPSAPASTVSSYFLPVDAGWDIDVWGRVRRLVEASRAEAKASEADIESARLSVQTAVAQDYFQLRTLDTEERIFSGTIKNYRQSLKITENRYASGIASSADVLQAETQLRTTQAQAIDIGVLRAQLEHAIALLIGKPASDFSIPPHPLAGHPVLPVVPAGLPSGLLERRPDIAAAERLVAAANARIGVAKAAFYPSVTLNGSAGFRSSSFFDWLSWPSRFWSVGPAIAETVFEGGLRRALTEDARAAYDANVAFYRQTVLAAFGQVEDNLAALRILGDEARAQDRAVKASARTVSVVTNQYKAGVAAYLDVIAAQTARLANEKAAAQIMGSRLTASVLLIKALGGGWNVSEIGIGNTQAPGSGPGMRKR